MFKFTVVLSLTVCALSAQTNASRASGPAGLDLTAIDKSVDPCVDFYHYACGTWMKNNPIPPDQAMWGRFSELQDRNRDILHEILEQSEKGGASRDATTQKIGDFYGACMDEKGIDARGLTPLEPELARIRNLKDKAQLADVIAHLQSIGVGALFAFYSGQDFKNSNEVIAQFDQGGLGLPDRDYYLKDDPKSVELRQKYVAHVARMMELAGAKPDRAKADADSIMKLETALAKGSLDLVSRRDPEKVYHKMTKVEFVALSPDFRWNDFFTTTRAPAFETINVAYPEFAKTVNTEIENTPLADWKTYLTWHLLHSATMFLPTPFVNETFNFYSKTLNGTEALRPRWKRCVDYTDGDLGEALGKKYVEKTFGAEGKERTLKMVAALEKALGEDIQQLDWMTPETKQQALIKLKAITNKIGYPDHWRDYSSVIIKPDDALGNDIRSNEFEFHRDLNKIGKPVDRQEWAMTPPTVNAYYDPEMNNINFPAGILQPPFFYKNGDEAVNFGGIGMVIGHELTHGFDDQGSQFDAHGDLKNWWTPKDSQEFHQREACIADEYGGFSVAPGVFVNGKLTLGEDTADNGGVRIALMALLNSIGNNTAKIDGYTPEQRFFLSFGQIWCENARPEALRTLVTTNEHAPPEFRVEGVVENSPEFRQAFSCKVGQPMAPAHACHVW
ncbi:MAG TPA: M13 family metallopeptidase [Bryobacteraceae bacterium]|nr:M13 family metallopeptidase [Bryobacteraceae bacterium]